MTHTTVMWKELVEIFILLLISYPMTVVERVKVHVCSFCLEFHKQYMKNAPFNYGRKEAVTDCRLCEQSMCADCQASSHKELQGDMLAIYGLTICQRCVTQVRRLTTRHKDYEWIVARRLEMFKAVIRKEIYTLTQEKHAVSDKHL